MQTFYPFLYLMSLNTPKVTTPSLGKGFTCRGASKKDVKLLTSLHLGAEFLEKCMFSLRRSVFVELEDHKSLWMLICVFWLSFSMLELFDLSEHCDLQT